MPIKDDNSPTVISAPTATKSRIGRSGVATIHDVAERAGVSIKTVSRVVNREPNVREEVARRVQQAVAELDYRPNFSARNLAGRKAYLIALTYDNPSASYLMGIQDGALRACKQLGYSVLLHPCAYDGDTLVDDLLALIRERRPAGLVLTPPLSDSSRLLDVLDSKEVDYVCIGSIDTQHRGPIVRADDQRGADEVTSYLLNLGHRRIAFIQGHPAHLAAQTRTEGFLQAHREQGVEPDPQLIVQGTFSFDSGMECARVLLTRRPLPTAIFAANDEMAAGVLHVAHDLGIQVPAQLSVVGFDDVPTARRVWPSLTTVRQPIKAMAEMAVEVLVNFIAERAHGKRQERRVEVMRTELIVRDSTAPPSQQNG